MKVTVTKKGKVVEKSKSYLVCINCECEFTTEYETKEEHLASMGLLVECPNCSTLVEINN